MNTVDLLLSLDNADLEVTNEKELEMKRLSKIAKKPFMVKVHGIGARRFTKLANGVTGKDGQVQYDKAFDVNISLCLAGMSDPDLKNKDLLEKFQFSTPGELLEKLFKPSEIAAIGDAVTELSGFGGSDVVAEVKN